MYWQGATIKMHYLLNHRLTFIPSFLIIACHEVLALGNDNDGIKRIGTMHKSAISSCLSFEGLLRIPKKRMEVKR